MAKREEIIQQLAEKYNLPPAKIEKAVNSQFKFVSEKMTEDHLPSIRLPYFGIFKVNKNRVKHLNRKSKNKRNNKNE